MKIYDNERKKNDATDKAYTKCEEIVFNILASSKEFSDLTNGLNERIIKNGGIGYGVILEGSPDASSTLSMGYSKTYDFNIEESYYQYIVTIDRFRFDPDTKQLYKYEIVDDEYVAIDFDRSLLYQLEAVCPK